MTQNCMASPRPRSRIVAMGSSVLLRYAPTKKRIDQIVVLSSSLLLDGIYIWISLKEKRSNHVLQVTTTYEPYHNCSHYFGVPFYSNLLAFLLRGDNTHLTAKPPISFYSLSCIDG